jgi:class 3 adenylate cyclase
VSWDLKRSTDRVERDLENLPEIEVKKLERDADLESLLSASVCREIFGSHAYLDISNFSSLTTLGEDEDSLKLFVRAVHIYQRQLAWIVESKFDGIRVHFQGPRVHVVFYRPIDDSEALASKAALLMLTVRDFLRYVFNPCFVEFESLTLRAGADIGDVIGTQNGMRGDRELLFLGGPANEAAKVIDSGLRLTSRLYEALPAALQAFCELIDEDRDIYRLTGVGKDDLDALLEDHDITWDREEAKERVESDIESFALDEIEFASATELIDFDALSIRSNKQVLAASIFADVTGFTAYVASASTADAKEEVLAAFHVIRSEFTRVVTHDTNGIRVQFQGDCLQAILHLPADNTTQIARKAVDLAIWLQSTMESVLRKIVPGAANLHIAVGVDMGVVVATRLGTRGHRDRIVLGSSVLEAAANEERTTEKQIGISSAIYDELEADVKEHFVWSASSKCYVATSLTVAALERKKEAAKYATSAAVSVISSGSAYRVTREEVRGGTTVIPPKSYGV